MSRSVRDFTHQDLFRFYKKNLNDEEKEKFITLIYSLQKKRQSIVNQVRQINDLLTSLIPLPGAELLNKAFQVGLDWFLKQKDDGNLDLKSCQKECEKVINE